MSSCHMNNLLVMNPNIQKNKKQIFEDSVVEEVCMMIIHFIFSLELRKSCNIVYNQDNKKGVDLVKLYDGMNR